MAKNQQVSLMNRIDPHNTIELREEVAYNLFSNRKKSLMQTFATLNLRLFTNAFHPFILAGWCITRFSCFLILLSFGEYIFTLTKEIHKDKVMTAEEMPALAHTISSLKFIIGIRKKGPKAPISIIKKLVKRFIFSLYLLP